MWTPGLFGFCRAQYRSHFGSSLARLSQLLFVKGHVGMCLCVWHFLFRGRCRGQLLATRCTGDQSVGVQGRWSVVFQDQRGEASGESEQCVVLHPGFRPTFESERFGGWSASATQAQRLEVGELCRGPGSAAQSRCAGAAGAVRCAVRQEPRGRWQSCAPEVRRPSGSKSPCVVWIGRRRCCGWQEPVRQVAGTAAPGGRAVVPDGRRRCCWAAGATLGSRSHGASPDGRRRCCRGHRSPCVVWIGRRVAVGSRSAGGGGASGRDAAPGGRSHYVGRQETLLLCRRRRFCGWQTHAPGMCRRWRSGWQTPLRRASGRAEDVALEVVEDQCETFFLHRALPPSAEVHREDEEHHRGQGQSCWVESQQQELVLNRRVRRTTRSITEEGRPSARSGDCEGVAL